MLARTTTLHSVSSEMHEFPMVLHASPGPPTLHSVFAHFQHAQNHIRLETTEAPELHEFPMILSFWGQGPEGRLASHPAGRPAGPARSFFFPGTAGWAGPIFFLRQGRPAGPARFLFFSGPAGWAGQISFLRQGRPAGPSNFLSSPGGQKIWPPDLLSVEEKKPGQIIKENYVAGGPEL